ncbi:MAG: glycine cleavage system protein H [bacterium]
MTNTMKAADYLKQGLVVFGLFAALVVLVPLMAILVFALRPLLLVGMALAAVALLVSPGFRRWLAGGSQEIASHRGLHLPSGTLLHPGHSWARRQAQGDLEVGVDDLLQRALGPVESVELPELGTVVTQGQPLYRLRRGDRTVEVKAPVDGEVTRVNNQLVVQPHRVNDAPYGDGWAAWLKPTRPEAAVWHLRQGRAAWDWFRAEVDRLIAALSTTPLPTRVLQDGGPLVEELHLQIDDETWQRLNREFF